jgi:hypothetical protein
VRLPPLSVSLGRCLDRIAVSEGRSTGVGM